MLINTSDFYFTMSLFTIFLWASDVNIYQAADQLQLSPFLNFLYLLKLRDNIQAIKLWPYNTYIRAKGEYYMVKPIRLWIRWRLYPSNLKQESRHVSWKEILNYICHYIWISERLHLQIFVSSDEELAIIDRKRISEYIMFCSLNFK